MWWRGRWAEGPFPSCFARAGGLLPALPRPAVLGALGQAPLRAMGCFPSALGRKRTADSGERTLSPFFARWATCLDTRVAQTRHGLAYPM